MLRFDRPRNRSSNRDVGEQYDVHCSEVKFYCNYKCIKYFEELLSFHEIGNDLLELLQRYK